MDVAELAGLLHETAEHHDRFEKASPPHNWWDWYAAYFNARQRGQRRPSRRTRSPIATWRRCTVSSPAEATMPFRFEVTTLPVADVDRAKEFYVGLGWRMDIDFEPGPGVRVVQIDPSGLAGVDPVRVGRSEVRGAAADLYLVVDDIVAARDDLVGRGVEVSDFFHLVIGEGNVPGLDPERATYASRATFADPDGNTWLLQEITDRLPGR